MSMRHRPDPGSVYAGRRNRPSLLRRWGSRLAILSIAAGVVAGCGGSAPLPPLSAGGSNTGAISVMYSTTGMFVSEQVALTYMASIERQFEADYPGAKINLIPVGGSDSDEQTKVELDMRSAATSPDIAITEEGTVGELQESGFIRPLTTYADSSSFWGDLPKSIQQSDMINGQVYSANIGNNVSQLYYSKPLLAKAGIRLPWQPRTWNDILRAARRIKSVEPGVVPLFVYGGAADGAFGTVYQSFANLLVGSSTPYVVQPGTNKWVVDSPGLRESLSFYKTVFSEGLGPPPSQLVGPNIGDQLGLDLVRHTAAIALGSNWWVTFFYAPGPLQWRQVASQLGVAKIPTIDGPGFATTIAGWYGVVSRYTHHARLAWDFINLLEKVANSVTLAKVAGFVPPTHAAAASRDFMSFDPPAGQFALYANFATPMPATPGFGGYARGIELATYQVAQRPSTSISEMVNTIRTQTVNAVGAQNVVAVR